MNEVTLLPHLQAKVNKKNQLKQLLTTEFLKCKKEPIYFIKKYCYIQHPIKGRIKFELYNFQEKTLELIIANRYTIILKSRQLGISTLLSAYALWLALFNDDKNILVLATKQKVAVNLVTKVKEMYKNLPKWLQKMSDVELFNRLSIRFKNGSQIGAESAAGDAGRSESCSFLICDESAFINGMDAKFASIQQTLGTGGGCCMLSTPNGYGNLFHKLYTEAETGLNEFVPIKLKWDVHPDHDITWRRAQDDLIGERLASQECLDANVTVYNNITNEIDYINIAELYNKSCNKYKILTPSGFQNFEGIQKVVHEKYLDITFSDNTNVKCSLDHPFILDGIKIHANELYEGCLIDNLADNDIFVKSIKLINEQIELYDLINVDNGHIFAIDNSIISSNCDCAFNSSGNTVIEPQILDWYKINQIKNPIEKRGVNHSYWIWEYPDFNELYVVCADVARGDGNDYSAAHVIKLSTMTQVAEFKEKVTTKEYGNILATIATEYNYAYLAVENANIGWSVLQQLIDLNYTNLHYTTRADMGATSVDAYIMKGIDLKDKNDLVPGFTTSSRTRPLIINNLENLVRERQITINSQRLWDELSVFVYLSGGKAAAQNGYNDDLVMSFAIGLWLRETAIRFRSEAMASTSKSLMAMASSVTPNNNSIGVYSSTFNNKNSWQYNQGKHQIDLSEFI